jgi:hypothetical protein
VDCIGRFFTFRMWLAGLCLGILVAFGLSFLAFRGSRLAIVVAYPVALLMFASGIGHIAASLYRRRAMPEFILRHCSLPHQHTCFAVHSL